MPEPAIIVTGATGFIGSALVRRLSADGATVVALTRDANRPAARRLAELDGVELREAASAAALNEVFTGLAARVVVHAAAPGVHPEDRHWSTLLDGAIGYTLALVEAAAERRVARILHLGSWSAYADPSDPDRPLSETDQLTRTNLYGACKASAELIAAAQAQALGIEFVSARLFNVFGPGEDERRLLPYVIRKLSAGEPVELTSGVQQRDFVFIDDAVEALVRLANARAPRHAVYNICSGASVPVRSLVEAACEAVSASPSLLRFGALPQRRDEPLRICGDPARMRAEFGWSPSVGPLEGVRRVVDQYTHKGASE